MAQNVNVCEIAGEVQEVLKKFRFRKEKTNAAILLKIDPAKMEVIIDEQYEDCTIEELQSELPEHQPRFVVLSYVYNHGDGRVSYPLCFVYICPGGGKPELSMMYAGSRTAVEQTLGFTKTFELRSVEEFTEEWLVQKLQFFR